MKLYILFFLQKIKYKNISIKYVFIQYKNIFNIFSLKYYILYIIYRKSSTNSL